MLAAEYDVFDIREIEDIDEFPSPAAYDMPRQGLGGIGDFFGKVLDIGGAVAKNYMGITQPQPMQAPPQYLQAPQVSGGAYVQQIVPQPPQSILQMPYMRSPYQSPKQPSFFEENTGMIIGIGGLAVVAVIVATRRK